MSDYKNMVGALYPQTNSQTPADFENVDITTSTTLPGETDRNPSIPSPAVTSIYYKDEIPKLDNYVDQIIKQTINPPVSGLQRADIFPGADQPVTQQGYSGKTFSAPTIAPTGGLFPYALLQERRASERLAKERALASGRYQQPDVYGLKNLEDNDRYLQMQYRSYDDVYKKGSEMSLKNYGTTAYAGHFVQEEANRLARSYDDIAKGYNAAYDTAQKIVTAPDKSMYTKDQAKAANYIMFEGLDALDKDPSNQEIISEIQSNINKIVGEYKPIDEFTTDITKNLTDETNTTIKEIQDQLKAGADYYIIEQLTASSPFLAIDDNGNFVFDDNGFEDYVRNQYAPTYEAGIRMPETEMKEIIRQAKAKTKFEVKSQLSNLGKDMTWRKAYADMWKTKKTKELEKETYNIGDTKITIGTAGGNKEVPFTNGYGLKQGTIISAPIGTKVINQKTGEEYTTSETVEISPIGVGNMDKQDAYDPGSGKIITVGGDRYVLATVTEEKKVLKTGEEGDETTLTKESEVLIPLKNINKQMEAVYGDPFINAEAEASKNKNSSTEIQVTEGSPI